MLHIRIEQSRITVMFEIVRSLAVPVLLNTSFLDRFIEVIFLNKRKIVSCNTRPVRILMLHETEIDKTEES